MIERFEQGKLAWISLKNPTTEEAQEVMISCDIPPSLMTDLSTPVPQSEAIIVDGVIKITLDFPIVKRVDMQYPHEIKFIVSKNSLVTVQYEDMEATDRFKKQFEVASTLHKGNHSKMTGAHLYILLMNELYNVMESKLDYLESKLLELEEQISQDKEKEIIFELSKMSKRMIAFRHVIRSHEDVLKDVKVEFEAVFQHSYSAEVEDLQDTYNYLLRRLTTLFESLVDLRETNFALLTTKQNEVMKILTIMAFVTFPLSLLTSTFGMNTVSTPIVGDPGDFWIIVSIMVSAMVCFFIFFKYKRWI